MTLLEFWVQSEAAKALGWTLLHSLWEGAGVALALAIALGVARSSRVRYAAACVALLAMLIGFGGTLYRLMPRDVHRVAVGALPHPTISLPDDRPTASDHTPWDMSGMLPWLAPIWLAGVSLFQLRCLVSWAAAGRLRKIGVCGVPGIWIARLDDLRSRLRMTRPVLLLESCFTEVPVVIGHLRPVILMPVGLLAGLPPAQVEAILLHELGHIRRADFLVNLMQTLVEGLLFYHPAAWWISGVIRAERENCCDDLVVSTNGDAHEYASALAALAENRWAIGQAAMAATGGDLVKRIRRLLAQPEGPRATIAPILSVGILVVTGAVALAAWQKPAPQLPIPATVLIRPVPLLIAQEQPVPATSASKYDKWLKEDVVYIITDRERADFKNVRTDAARDRFIEDFWKRRDPTPGTPENEYKIEHYRRISYVNDRFRDAKLPGWKTDRGRIYIQYGPPDEIDAHPNGGAYTRPSEEGGAQTVTYPFEMWRYRFIEGIGNNVIMEFVDRGRTGEYRLTMDPKEKAVARRPLERELEDLKEQLAAVPTDQLQQQMEMAEKQLRALELSNRSQLDLRQVEQSQKQIEALQEKMQALVERLNSDPNRKELLAAQKRIMAEQGELETVQMELDALNNLHAGLDRPRDSSVFFSGAGTQAAVVILPNRTILVSVPLEFAAGQYTIDISTTSADGKTVRSKSMTEPNHGNPSSLAVGLPIVPPGTYTLKALVKNAAGPNQKTYVVNFSVK